MYTIAHRWKTVQCKTCCILYSAKYKSTRWDGSKIPEYYYKVLHCSVLFCIVLYHSVYHTVLYVPYCMYRTVLHCIALYRTILYILYCTAPYHTIPYHTVLYSTCMYHTVLYWPYPTLCIIMYYTVLSFIMQLTSIGCEYGGAKLELKLAITVYLTNEIKYVYLS